MIQTHILKLDPPYQIIHAGGEVGLHIATLVVTKESETEDETNEVVANCDHPEEVIANCENPQENSLSQYDIEKLIVTVRGEQVLIDQDIARIYGVTTGRLNEQAKRNIAWFPESFQTDLKKHNEQYREIKFIQLPQKNHDRFLIIDDDVYLLGASVKDMGVGMCAVTKMQVSPETILQLLK